MCIIVKKWQTFIIVQYLYFILFYFDRCIYLLIFFLQKRQQCYVHYWQCRWWWWWSQCTQLLPLQEVSQYISLAHPLSSFIGAQIQTIIFFPSSKSMLVTRQTLRNLHDIFLQVETLPFQMQHFHLTSKYPLFSLLSRLQWCGEQCTSIYPGQDNWTREAQRPTGNQN